MWCDLNYIMRKAAIAYLLFVLTDAKKDDFRGSKEAQESGNTSSREWAALKWRTRKQSAAVQPNLSRGSASRGSESARHSGFIDRIDEFFSASEKGISIRTKVGVVKSW